MRAISLFFLKNSLASKMKRGIRSVCTGVGSTSTLIQAKADRDASIVAAPSVTGSYMEESSIAGSPLTLEQMLLQLDLEEAAARRMKLERRMSCVNNSDILRSARDALNQYPRFSLDGRDAMYRSSFRNLGLRTGGFEGGRRSVCCSGSKGRSCKDRRSLSHLLEDDYEVDMERDLGLPSTVGGERVVWCKPGVVAKLMGLDAVPVPSGNGHGKKRLDPNPTTCTRRENMRGMLRDEVERKRLVMGVQRCKGRGRREGLGSCSAHDRCMLNPICRAAAEGREDWRYRRAR